MWEGVYNATRPSDAIGGVVGSAGGFTGWYGPCPEGYCWYVERETCWSNTSAQTGVLELFVLPTNAGPIGNDKSGRQDVASGAVVQNGVSDNRSPIFVPPGYYVVAVWSGLTQGDLVALSLQIRMHKTVEARSHVHGHRHGHGLLGELEKLGRDLTG